MPEQAAQEIRGLAILLLARLDAIEQPTLSQKKAIGHLKAGRSQMDAVCTALIEHVTIHGR